MKTFEAEVYGKVQGVWFRASTKEQAEKLGVTGWVMNRSDGSVFALFTGPEAALDKMLNWCRKGPPNALVSEVNYKEVSFKAFDGFEIRR